MNAFLAMIIVLFAVEGIGKLSWLVTEPPVRTKREIAVDIVVLVLIVVWAIVLLVSGK